jgi:predicted dehydrogenase
LDAAAPAAAADYAARFSGGRGVDAVLIAAATASPEPVRMAARMCRQRGRIVLTGVAGLELERDLFYKKELSFQVSCSYGPGRYDDAYEKRGQDYPFGYVRWTAQRNFEAALDLMADRRLDVRPLVTHEFPLEQAQQAYQVLTSGEPSLGILLRYATAETARPAKLDTRIVLSRYQRQEPATRVAVTGLIGAGDFAGKVLLPAMRSAGVTPRTVVSASGLGAAWAARRFGISEATTEERAVLEDPSIDTVVIATRHDSHAGLAVRALRAGKSVWVEKPLAMTEQELDEIEEVCTGWPEARLMTGFNRRFAPLTQSLRRTMKPGRHDFRYTVNAGATDATHWTADVEEGGGRILGEACHFIDLLRALAGSPIANLEARRSGAGAQLWMEFTDGSTGTVDYLTEGSRRFSKERLEVFGAGQVLSLENFRRLVVYPSFAGQWLPRWGGQDKGHKAAIAAFFTAVRRGTPPPIPIDEQLEVSRWAIRAAEALR